MSVRIVRAVESVSFIIPVRDDAERLRGCLQAIAATSGARREVIVADNGSDDDSPAVAAAAAATVLRLPGRTVAELRNAAAACATGDVLAFVDADHQIDPAWVQSAVETLRAPAVGAAGAAYHPPPGLNWVQRAYDRLRRHPSGVQDVEWLGSGNLAVARAVFNAVGGFDTALETCEDVDLCNRIRKAGFRVVSDERLRTVHFGDPSSIGALFRAELWRGQGNLRASLRSPLTLGALPSIVIPVVDLVLLAAVVAGVVALPAVGAVPGAAGAGGFVLLAVLRAVRMTASSGSRALELLPNFAVACAYDLARALALVVPASHRIRRDSAGASCRV